MRRAPADFTKPNGQVHGLVVCPISTLPTFGSCPKKIVVLLGTSNVFLIETTYRVRLYTQSEMPIFHPHVYSNSGEIPSESHKDILVYLLPKKRRNSVAAKPV
jgi:hypothetical protein